MRRTMWAAFGAALLVLACGASAASAEITPQDPLPLHPKPQPDPERIAALAKLLNEAKAPMLWVGGGAQHASAEIRALAERYGERRILLAGRFAPIVVGI